VIALIAHLNAVFLSEFVRKDSVSFIAGIIRLHKRIILLTESLKRTMGLGFLLGNANVLISSTEASGDWAAVSC